MRAEGPSPRGGQQEEVTVSPDERVGAAAVDANRTARRDVSPTLLRRNASRFDAQRRVGRVCTDARLVASLDVERADKAVSPRCAREACATGTGTSLAFGRPAG